MCRRVWLDSFKAKLNMQDPMNFNSPHRNDNYIKITYISQKCSKVNKFKLKTIYSDEMTIAENISHGTFLRHQFFNQLVFRPQMSKRWHFKSRTLNIWETQRLNFRIISFLNSRKCYLIYTFCKVFGVKFDMSPVVKPSSAHKTHFSWLQLYSQKHEWIKTVSMEKERKCISIFSVLSFCFLFF